MLAFMHEFYDKGRFLPRGFEAGPRGLAWKPDPGVVLLLLGCGFASGIAVLFLLPVLLPGWLALLLFAFGLGLLLVRRLWARVLALALFGFCWAHLRACGPLCEVLPESLLGQTLIAEGRVASLPDLRQDSVRFLFRIERLSQAGEPVDFHALVRLSWYRDAPQLAAGQAWRLALRLKPPHGFVNPGGFDYERWLFQQGISATGYVRHHDENRLLDEGPGFDWLNRWRQRLRQRLQEALGEDELAAALVQALVLGDRSGLTPAQWEVFSRTGTNHLIAISGLHVGLLAGFVFLLMRWLWSRSIWLIDRLAAPRAAALAALGAAAGYAALAGFAISTQRALLMFAVLMLALLAGRTPRPTSGLVLALMAVLLLDPASLLSYGFWLSFSAVAVLLYALGRRLSQPVAVFRWGRAQWAVALGLLPMLLLFFGRASLAAPLVNLIAVPLFTLLLPLVLIAAAGTLVFAWYWPLAMVGLLLGQCYVLLVRIADLPIASMTLGGRADWVWVSAVAGVMLLLAPRGLPARWLGLVFLLPLALMRPPPPAAGEAHFTLLDVGQGLSAVVQTRAHTLVYDLGPRYRSGFETGTAVVLPYLRANGIRRLDLLLASHADQDHIGGLHALLQAIPVTKIISGEPDQLEIADVIACRAGQHWQWDGVDFAILHPEHDGYQGNNASCLLRISTAGVSLLLTGDLEQRVERMLVAERGDRLRSDILVAGHHGSATSTSTAFLAAVDPAWVLYSSGYANRWGFPVASVRERVQTQGARVAGTAMDGALSFVLPATGALSAPQRARDQDRRIWRHRPER